MVGRGAIASYRRDLNLLSQRDYTRSPVSYIGTRVRAPVSCE